MKKKNVGDFAGKQDFLFSAQKADRFLAWGWDLTTDALSIDRTAAAELGFGPEITPQTGSEWFRMIDPDDKPILLDAIGRAMQNGGEYSAEVRMRRPGSAETVWAETRGRVTRDAAGQPVRVDGVLLDVTQRKRGEAAARSSDAYRRRLLELFARKTTRQEYLDAVVEALREWSGCNCVGIRVADSKGGAPYESFVGFTKDFWTKEDGLSLVTDECICVRVATGRHASFERGQVTPAGSFACGDAPGYIDGLAPVNRARHRGTCIVEGYNTLAVVPIRRDGDAIGLIHVADKRPNAAPPSNVEFLEQMAVLIGEAIYRFKIEDQLRTANSSLEKRAAQLQAVNAEAAHAEDRERRRIAQTLHDDLQQLLVAAKFGLNSLRPHLPDDGPRGVLQDVDGLLAQSVDMSRSLASELSPPILNDRGLVAGLEWLARWMGETYGLRVDLQIADGADPSIDDLRFFLFTTIRALLLNVVEHSGAHRVVVSAAPAEYGLARVTVSDDGAGIDPALLTSAAEPKKAGLFQIRERLEFMGGRLDVNSVPGRGTQIVVTAPVMRGKAAMAAAAPGWDSDSKPNGRDATLATRAIRVVVVDDHAVFRHGLIGLLQREKGIVVVGQAADGMEAVETTRRVRPDVVVMDVTMPRMNGIEATKAILAEMPEVKVVGLSMHDRADMAEAMQSAGAAGYLPKDSPPDEIVAGIRRACADCDES